MIAIAMIASVGSFEEEVEELTDRLEYLKSYPSSSTVHPIIHPQLLVRA
jgi:hypothetical protein